MRTLFSVTVAFLMLCNAASADPKVYNGNVYGIYPEGVMIQQPGGSYLVPHTMASFQVGGVSVSYSNLQIGQPVQAFVPVQSVPHIITIGDCYQWHVKHHPDHPHGGPPGQTGVHPGKGQGKSKNKGNGKH